MKNISLWATGLLMLAGCETSNRSSAWEDNCLRNYSENQREFEACMKRRESNAMKNFSGKSGTVSMDPKNASIPADDEIRKSRD